MSSTPVKKNILSNKNLESFSIKTIQYNAEVHKIILIRTANQKSVNEKLCKICAK